MEKAPKVSVLIPNYNYARFLDEAINSVLNQTLQDFEIIIVDNNSRCQRPGNSEIPFRSENKIL